MHQNEDSRVKLPAILHLTQLGYKFFGNHRKSINLIQYDTYSVNTNILRSTMLTATKNTKHSRFDFRLKQV